MKHTYLGPSQSTFSALAHQKFIELFGIPTMRRTEELLAENNEQVVPLVVQHGGIGVIAMETEAEGRIEPPINSFVSLVNEYQNTENCPIRIMAAIRLPVSFVLMARRGVNLEDVNTVIAHPKALGACKNRLQVHRFTHIIQSDSNGKAAEEVANNPEFAKAAALGPVIAAEKYGLRVLMDRQEDRSATTTFFFLGSPRQASYQGEKVKSEVFRSFLVFRLKHEPGALVKVLLPFSERILNLRQIHSRYIADSQYDFAIEIESCGTHTVTFQKDAMCDAKKHMLRHIFFGPFPVL